MGGFTADGVFSWPYNPRLFPFSERPRREYAEQLFAHARRHSRFLARCLDGNLLDLNLLADWTARRLSEDDFRHFADWQALRENEDEAGLARQLRILRRHVVAQIIVRDLNGLSGLDEVTQTITRFADFSVNTALDYAYGYYVGLYGTPTGRHSGEAQFLTVVAMGKAGGGELNVSSDIDLIFTYPEGGATSGRRERDNQEFFTKVGQKLIALLNDITPDGQVFRVDMRLRPDGDAGALVWSEAALEQYLITHGREWERYAWCKGRVITPGANDIAAIVRPFVFRKYLDYNAYEAMRGLHRQIRAEVGKKGMEDNIKLGAGGIREIEFIAQIFQMIRAGRLKTLQLKGTQETLRQLAVQNIIPAHTAETLLEAYRFLRQLEHRLQYWDDLQTQTLPQDAGQRQLLAESMGYTDYEAFSDGLNAHRAAVTAEFDNILSEPEEQPAARFAALWPEPAEEHIPLLQQAGFEAEDTIRRLHALRLSTRYRSLSPRSQPRFDALMPQIIQAAADTRRPTETLSRLTGFLETVSRRPVLSRLPARIPQRTQPRGRTHEPKRVDSRLPATTPHPAGRTPERTADRQPTRLAAAAGRTGCRTGRLRRCRSQNGHPAPLPPRPHLPTGRTRPVRQMDG